MPIALGIDHLIIAVHDLEAATAAYRDLLGLQVSGGGSHPQFGTANRIIVLGDDYLELLAASPGAEPQGWIGALLAAGHEGCAGFALQTEDPAAAAATLRERGIACDGPSSGRLDAANGFSRGWQTVRLAGPAGTALPFLIRHDAAGEERRRLLANLEAPGPHTLGARRVAGIAVAVENLDTAEEIYRRAFDLEREGERGEDAMLGAATSTLRLPSRAAIVLAAPQWPDHGPVAAALRERGEGLFAITLAVDDLEGAVRTLRGRGLGVRVEEPEGILVAAQLNHRQLHGARLALVRDR